MAGKDPDWKRSGWRALSPVGLILVLACMWLPFLVSPPPSSLFATVAPSVTYTGLDLAFGGTAEVLVPNWQLDGSYEVGPISDQEMYGYPQRPLVGSVYGAIAVVLIGVGILASLIPVGRLRAVVSGCAALLGALALLGLELAQRRAVAGMLPELLGPVVGLGPDSTVPLRLVSLRPGFLAAMALLVAVGFDQIAVAIAGPARRPVEPAEPR